LIRSGWLLFSFEKCEPLTGSSLSMARTAKSIRGLLRRDVSAATAHRPHAVVPVTEVCQMDLHASARSTMRCAPPACAYCRASGAGGKTWRAYLSTQAADDKPAINARDRIGPGPWQNFKGEVVAQSVDDLHSDNNKLNMQTSLTERGAIIPGVGYAPNRHDALTGSQADGRAFPAGDDRTCHNWTSSTQGAAMLGHIDRKGLRDDAASRSWNSSHPSRGPDGGCSQADLRSTGGDGLFYCFAAQ
jgi:hypothetical protein